MSDVVLMLDRSDRTRGHAMPERAELVDSVALVREGARRKRAVWIASRADDLALFGEFNDRLFELKGDHRLVVRDRVGRGRSEVLRARFRYVVSADHAVKLLPIDQLVEVVSSPERNDLFIGVATDPEDFTVVLFRGSLEPLVVPMSFFGVGRPGAPADLPAFDVVDYGQAVRVGEREASADAVLYAFDADYRRRKKALRVEQDESFGGALRRLRILRGLPRTGFEGVSAKEIARIERGEVGRPHQRTLELLARRLGVGAGDITSY